MSRYPIRKKLAYERAVREHLGEDPPAPPHVSNFEKNVGEVLPLVSISDHMDGEVDCKHNLDVLYKSAVVLLVACWESYVEDVAEGAFEFMLQKASGASAFPEFVLTVASEGYSNMRVWEVAGDGWKTVLKNNYRMVRGRTLEKFHSPKSHKIDELYKRTIGLGKLSQHWTWQGMSSKTATRKLDELISLR